MSNRQTKPGSGEAAEDLLQMSEIMLRLYNARWSMFVLAASGLLLAGLWLTAYNHFKPAQFAFSTGFQLDAKGAKFGHYPNGLAFTPNDIRSAAVLDAAFKNFQRNHTSLDRSDLDAMVSVIPYAPEMDVIRNRYLRKLGEKNITNAERDLLEQEFAAARSGVKLDGGLLKLTMAAGTLSESDAAVLAEAILENWSRIFVNEYSVASLPLSIKSKRLTNPQTLEADDYPLAYRRLELASAELMARASEMTSLPGIEGTKVDGRTITDVVRDARQLDELMIKGTLAPLAYAGLARDPAYSSAKLEFAAQTVRDNIAELARQSRNIDEILEQASQKSGIRQPNSTETTSTSLVQFGDTAADRLIDLAVNNAAQPFIQELLKEKQAIGKNSAAQETELARIERLKRALDVTGSTLRTNAAKEFSDSAKAAAHELNEMWLELNSLAASASVNNLNPARSLYSKFSLPESTTITGGVRDPLAWGIALLLVFAFAASGVVRAIARAA